MTKTPPKDIGASVRARLSRLARERGEDFQFVLTRYANERLLFRLASSRHAQQFVLKGSALFTLWTGKPHRATCDLDLLDFGDPGVDHVREVFARSTWPTTACTSTSGPPRLASSARSRVRRGVRAELVARITNAQVRLQVDVGFGDAEATVVARVRSLCLVSGLGPARAGRKGRRRSAPGAWPSHRSRVAIDERAA
jgi:hypothetical protein